MSVVPGAAALFLADRTAFVTGAAQGLGQAIARGLAEAGARVALADIDTDGVQSAAETLRRAGHEAIALPLDVRDEAAFITAFTGALARIGSM